MLDYNPLQIDDRLEEAKRFIDNLSDSEDSELIKYYIMNKDDTIKELMNRLEEYGDFCEQLNRLLPNNNPVFM